MAKFQCKKCGREFAHKKHLDQHKRRKTPCSKTFQCDKCFKSFPNQRELTRHGKRKTPCAPEEVPVIKEDNPDNRCQFCNNTYATPSSLKRHQKTCDKDKNMQVIIKLMEEQNKKMDTMQVTIEKQDEKIDTLSKQLVVPGNTTINNDNRQLNIQFVNFPIQDMSSIDMTQILRIVDTSEAGQIIPAIVEHIHGNPNHPDKQNVFMTKLGSDVTIVYGGLQEKTWHSIPKQEAFDQLKLEAMGILTHRNQPRTNYQLLEAAQEINHKDTSYQDKIADLTENDLTENVNLEKKLVGFGETFHSQRLALIQ